MKKIIAASITLLLFFSSCGGPTKQKALVYDDMVNGEFERFSNVYTEYAISFNSNNPQNMEDHRVYACNQALFSLDTIGKMKDFYGDFSYVNSLKNYVSVTLKSMQELDGPRIKLLMKDSLMTAQDSSEVKRLTTESLYMTDKAYIEFQKTQKDFRQKNEIKDEDL